VSKNIFKISAGLLAIGVLQCALSSGASAQVGNNCTLWVSCGMSNLFSHGLCLPAFPPGAFACGGTGSYTIICKIPSFLCAPPDAASETKCSCTQAGKPIDLASGNTYIAEIDVKLPGLSGGLSLQRTWNSLWPSTQSALQIGLFGPNWRSTFEERVFLGSDNYMKYGRSDGTFWSFGWAGDHWNVAAPANATAALTMGTSYYTITFQNGEQRLFDNSTGHLIEILDRNGNATTLSYDAQGRLTTVTDPVSRHLYFAYGNGSSYLVTSVTSDVGLAFSYSYDGQGRLTQITRPDQSTVNFQYNSQSLITAVTDSNGKILESHTYDTNGRGLTSASANGVDAVTVSYSTP
jgi:YD repeat-containing protein